MLAPGGAHHAAGDDLDAAVPESPGEQAWGRPLRLAPGGAERVKRRYEEKNHQSDPFADKPGWDNCQRSRMEADKRALEDQDIEEDGTL